MKEYKNQIEAVRGEIQALEEEQNKQYQKLLDTVYPSKEQESWLWDYCFNCPIQDKPDEYTLRVRKELFGEE